MGHLGLTPQSVHQLGYRRQATDPVAQQRLVAQAEALQAAGCFALVLEHVPAALAQQLHQQLTLPVIGIGAGPHCDGQVLVTADLLGMTARQPPFAQPLVNLRSQALEALRQWVTAQRAPTSPAASAAPHC
jgi:3-methyl-2-oxobutanoate hydroxymethyltransferase